MTNAKEKREAGRREEGLKVEERVRERKAKRERGQVEWDFFYTPVERLIEQGLAHGHNLQEIAWCMDTSKRTIERWAKAAGIRTPRNPGRPRKAVS